MSGPQPVPRPEWSTLPVEGAVGIEFKVLLPLPPPLIAMLRFQPNAGFPAHTALFDVDVVCLDGAGFVLVGDECGVAAPATSARRRGAWRRAGSRHPLTSESSLPPPVADPSAAFISRPPFE